MVFSLPYMGRTLLGAILEKFIYYFYLLMVQIFEIFRNLNNFIGFFAYDSFEY